MKQNIYMEDKSPLLKGGNISNLQIRQKSSNMQLFFNLLKACLGIGMLTLPYGVKQSGIITATTLTLFYTYQDYYALNLQIYVVDKFDVHNNYDQRFKIQKMADFGAMVAGAWGYHLVTIFVFILQMGICVAYVNRIFTFLMQLICIEHLDDTCQNKNIIFIIVLSIIIPLSMIRKLSTYSNFSGIAVIFVFISVLFISIYSFYNRYMLDILDKEYNSNLLSFTYFIQNKHQMINWQELPVFYGLLQISFEADQLIFEFRDSMENPQEFKSLLKKSFILISILYSLFPLICLYGFMDKTDEFVLFNLPQSNALCLFIQIIYMISLCITFPLQLFPILQISDEFISGKSNKNQSVLQPPTPTLNLKKKKSYRNLKLFLIYILRGSTSTLIFFIAYSIPDFSLFMSIIGNLGAGFLTFCLPIWSYHKFQKLLQYEINWKIHLWHFIFCLTGLFGTVLGIYDGIKEFKSKFNI